MLELQLASEQDAPMPVGPEQLIAELVWPAHCVLVQYSIHSPVYNQYSIRTRIIKLCTITYSYAYLRRARRYVVVELHGLLDTAYGVRCTNYLWRERFYVWTPCTVLELHDGGAGARGREHEPHLQVSVRARPVPITVHCVVRSDEA